LWKKLLVEALSEMVTNAEHSSTLRASRLLLPMCTWNPYEADDLRVNDGASVLFSYVPDHPHSSSGLTIVQLELALHYVALQVQGLGSVMEIAKLL
jgi:hypothetical protein